MKSLVRLRYRGTGTRSSIRLQGPTISAELLKTGLWPPFSRCSLNPRLIDTVNNNNKTTTTKHTIIYRFFLHLGNFLKSSAESVPRCSGSVHYHEDKTVVEFGVTHHLRRRENKRWLQPRSPVHIHRYTVCNGLVLTVVFRPEVILCGRQDVKNSIYYQISCSCGYLKILSWNLSGHRSAW